MIYHYRYLELAQADLLDVIDYLAEYSIEAADRFLFEFDKSLLRVRQFPKSCEIYRHNPTIRRLIVDKYLVFYEEDEENKLINIYRILHSSRDIEQVDFHEEIEK
jgi:plasmid stabilization system protein ParE